MKYAMTTMDITGSMLMDTINQEDLLKEEMSNMPKVSETEAA